MLALFQKRVAQLHDRGMAKKNPKKKPKKNSGKTRGKPGEKPGENVRKNAPYFFYGFLPNTPVLYTKYQKLYLGRTYGCVPVRKAVILRHACPYHSLKVHFLRQLMRSDMGCSLQFAVCSDPNSNPITLRNSLIVER